MNIKQNKIRTLLNNRKTALFFVVGCVFSIVLILFMGKEPQKNNYQNLTEDLTISKKVNVNRKFTEITSFSFNSINPFFMNYVKADKGQALIDGIDLDELKLDMIMINGKKSYAIVNNIKLIVGSLYDKYVIINITRKGITLKDRVGNVFFVSMY